MMKPWSHILLGKENMIKCLKCLKQGSYLQNYGQLWLGNSCKGPCLTVSLASAHQMSITHSPTSCDNRHVSRHCQVTPGEKYCPHLRNSALNILSGHEYREFIERVVETISVCFLPHGVDRREDSWNTFVRIFPPH